MAASQRVAILTNKSDELAVLLEFIADPNLFQKLQTEVKQLNALTEEEEKKAHEARILLQSRDKLIAEANATKEDLEKARQDHATELAAEQKEFDDYIAAEKVKLASEHKILDERKLTADSEETRLRQLDNQLREKIAKMKGLVGE